MAKYPIPLASLTIAIPAYNEARTIKTVLKDAVRVAQQTAQKFQIIVLNDGSQDITGAILKTLTKTIPQLQVITHSTNLGIEASLKELYQVSRSEYTFFNAADDDISMDVLKEMAIELSLNQADIVVGNRIIKNYTWKRRLISNLYNYLVWWLTGVKVWDAGTVKLVRTKYFQNPHVISTSVFGEAERLVRAVKRGAKLVKVDIHQNSNDRNDRVSLQQLIHCLWDLLRVSWAIRFR